LASALAGSRPKPLEAPVMVMIFLLDRSL